VVSELRVAKNRCFWCKKPISPTLLRRCFYVYCAPRLSLKRNFGEWRLDLLVTIVPPFWKVGYRFVIIIII